MEPSPGAADGSTPTAARPTAVVSSHHPDERLAEVVRTALLQCAQVIVVDNTPGPPPAPLVPLMELDRCLVLRTGHNSGLAAALNRGLAALEPDVDVVLLLDQDSVLPEQLVPTLADHLTDESIDAVGPTPVDVEGRPYDRDPIRTGLVEKTSLITSGMLVRTHRLRELDGFREDLFVDWVDNDLCLRLQRAGGRIFQDRSVTLQHSIGDVRHHRLAGRDVRVLHYPPWRHYWIARNGVLLARENLRPHPAWTLQCLLYLGRQVLTTVVFDSRIATGALLAGLRDGITGRRSARHLPEGAVVAHPERQRARPRGRRRRC